MMYFSFLGVFVVVFFIFYLVMALRTLVS